ncbi:hypothetical protein GDO86_018036, partial [Hymenochirus boettgeri]
FLCVLTMQLVQAMFRFPGTSLFLRVTQMPCVPPSRGRKSRTDPPAKSKLSRIKYPPLVCVQELLNVTRRYGEYNAILGAMRAEFKEGYSFVHNYDEKVRIAGRNSATAWISEGHMALMAWLGMMTTIRVHWRK